MLGQHGRMGHSHTKGGILMTVKHYAAEPRILSGDAR
jgi:hypothetical protein